MLLRTQCKQCTCHAAWGPGTLHITSLKHNKTRRSVLSEAPTISLLEHTFLTSGLFSKHFTVVTLPLKFSFPPKSLRQCFASQPRLQGTAYTLQQTMWVCTAFTATCKARLA